MVLSAAQGRTPHIAAHTIPLDWHDGVFGVLLRLESLQHPTGSGDGCKHAIAKVVASQPNVLRLAAISNEGLEGVEIPQLLNDWIQARNCRQSTSPLHG